MLGRAVALVLGKAVAGVQGVQFQHLTVTRHLGDNAGGGDGIGQGVPMDDAPFLARQSQAGQGVDQKHIGGRALGGPAHGHFRGLQNIVSVDFLRAGLSYAHKNRRFQNGFIGFFPAFGG